MDGVMVKVITQTVGLQYLIWLIKDFSIFSFGPYFDIEGIDADLFLFNVFIL